MTGDFTPFHPHHRGLFLAYVHTRWRKAEPDFWIIQNGTGRIESVGVVAPRGGPVAVRFEAQHRWIAAGLPGGVDGKSGERIALHEWWEVEAFDVPDSVF